MQFSNSNFIISCLPKQESARKDLSTPAKGNVALKQKKQTGTSLSVFLSNIPFPDYRLFSFFRALCG